MSPRWQSPNNPVVWPRPGVLGWVRLCVKGAAMVLLVFGCLLILLFVRLFERPIFGMHRPWTPHIVQFVCRNALRILRLDLEVIGTPINGHGVVVANHASWLDVFVLNACKRIYFVAKAEVAKWPGIGVLARATGTIFIERKGAEARKHSKMLQDRLGIGHRLLFFPEGTSTDGLQVLPFKSTLFDAMLKLNDPELLIQPATVEYVAPNGQDPRFYGWWGDMTFGEHLARMLWTKSHGLVRVHYAEPLRAGAFTNRKEIAAAAQKIVTGHLKGSTNENESPTNS